MDLQWNYSETHPRAAAVCRWNCNRLKEGREARESESRSVLAVHMGMRVLVLGSVSGKAEAVTAHVGEFEYPETAGLKLWWLALPILPDSGKYPTPLPDSGKYPTGTPCKRRTASTRTHPNAHCTLHATQPQPT